jgi:predicted DNA-binding mobile mystery protein A
MLTFLHLICCHTLTFVEKGGNMNKKRLIRKQIDKSLRRFRPLFDAAPPPKGWIRAIRDALGMTARQLANRLGTAQQSVSRIEREELAGSVSIKTMRKLAEGLDCIFVYGFVPRTSLEETIGRQAKKVAALRLAQASQTMSLENQALTRKETEEAFKDMVDDIIRAQPSNLWDES